jgi:membrane peptidoglycan carboxypeptidase
MLDPDRTPLSGPYTKDEIEAAKNEEVVLAPQATTHWIAPHFVWAVQKELADKLCGENVPTCDALDAGGLRVTTTLDVPLQGIAQKWVMAATRVPNARDPEAAAKVVGVKLENWMKRLRGKDLHNGALVALDYQTGQIVAYVGSADYYGTNPSPAFQPQYDVAGNGWRQPGSAFKPFNYLTGIDDGVMTAASMFMDSATDFGGGYTPSDADPLERGPVRVRNALQFSLNIPSVKAMAVNQPDHVFARAKDFGMTFQTDTTSAGLALALGVQEVRPVDLVTAYGTLANGGLRIPHTTILAIRNQAGEDVVEPFSQPEGEQVAKPQSTFIVTDILAGNTNPKVNPYWGKFAITNEAGDRRPATLKTGTNNDAKDLNAYGFIAPPTSDGRSAGEYALAVGAWNGNSDNSLVSTPDEPLFSIDVTTFVWQGFLNEATAKWAINDFAAPADGLVKAKVDPWTGLKPPRGGKSIEEWFLTDTAPKSSVPEGDCGMDVLQVAGFEKNFPHWLEDDANWIARATKGPGTRGGVNGTRTSYFYNGSYNPYGKSWGALVKGHGCAGPSASPSCFPLPAPDASGIIPSFELPTPDPSTGVAVVACSPPPPTPSPSASVEPSPTPELTPPPTAPPKPTKSPKPTPSPATPPPSAPPSTGPASSAAAPAASP